jgi:hypothetical protein
LNFCPRNKETGDKSIPWQNSIHSLHSATISALGGSQSVELEPWLVEPCKFLVGISQFHLVIFNNHANHEEHFMIQKKITLE